MIVYLCVSLDNFWFDDVRFAIDCMSHLLLTCFMSFYVVDSLDDTVSSFEYFLLFWFSTLLLEEVRQTDFFFSIVSYIKSGWNRLDVVFLLLYFTGFGLRISDPGSPKAKVTRHVTF